jgi:cytidine deaminase
MHMPPQIKQKLIDAALSARSHAYAPYSKFQVGAAVLTEDGTITTGANVENASYSLTICAERVAAAAAIAAGHQKIQTVAIASPGAAAPCGACRQFLTEFGKEIDILLIDTDNPKNIKEIALNDLLPQQFNLQKE